MKELSLDSFVRLSCVDWSLWRHVDIVRSLQNYFVLVVKSIKL